LKTSFYTDENCIPNAGVQLTQDMVWTDDIYHRTVFQRVQLPARAPAQLQLPLLPIYPDQLIDLLSNSGKERQKKYQEIIKNKYFILFFTIF
jgi:hypothetical protein